MNLKDGKRNARFKVQKPGVDHPCAFFTRLRQSGHTEATEGLGTSWGGYSEAQSDRAATTRLVGAGLALPSFYATDRLGQGKPSPYQTLEMFAKFTILQYSGNGKSGLFSRDVDDNKRT